MSEPDSRKINIIKFIANWNDAHDYAEGLDISGEDASKEVVLSEYSSY